MTEICPSTTETHIHLTEAEILDKKITDFANKTGCSPQYARALLTPYDASDDPLLAEASQIEACAESVQDQPVVSGYDVFKAMKLALRQRREAQAQSATPLRF